MPRSLISRQNAKQAGNVIVQRTLHQPPALLNQIGTHPCAELNDGSKIERCLIESHHYNPACVPSAVIVQHGGWLTKASRSGRL